MPFVLPSIFEMARFSWPWTVPGPARRSTRGCESDNREGARNLSSGGVPDAPANATSYAMPRTSPVAAGAFGVLVALLATEPAAAAGAPAEPPPRIAGVTPLVQLAPGARMCVCGHFPSAEAARSLRIDDRPVTLAGPFEPGVVTVRLPPGLAPGTHTVTGAPEAGYDPADRHEVRLVLIHSEVRRPLLFGSARRIRLTVAGTEAPVELRLKNLDPGVVRLTGGPVQELTTSGGRRNRATAKARFSVPEGRASLTVALAAPACACAGADEHGMAPERQDEMAGALERSVVDAEAWLRRRESTFRAQAIEGDLFALDTLVLLDELALRLEVATADPELAALRAWVEDRLAEERARWPIPWETVPIPSPPGGRRLTRAAYPAPTASPGAIPPAEAEGLLDRLLALFRTLHEVSRDLVVDLCVRSRPSRSEVWVQPKRYQPGRRTELTNTEFENLTRGLYVGRVEKPGEAPADFEVDLVREARIYVDCDLADGLCDRPPRPVEFSCREPEDRN